MRSWWMVLTILLAVYGEVFADGPVYDEVSADENHDRGDILEYDLDEEDLHNQPYNVTTRNAFNRIISLNTNTSVEVTGSGNMDSCEYRAPDGNTYQFSDSMQYPGVYIPNVGNSTVCRIVIGSREEIMRGEWQIIGKFSRNGILTEIRQPFNLIKEEHVEAFPQEVTVPEDNDIYVRLKYSTDQYHTCRLVSPKGEDNSPHYIDETQAQSCGYIIKSIKTVDQGVWQIVYGTNIMYRAFINVTVLAKDVSVTEDLVLIKDSKVNKTIGPYNAVYCKLEDPHGFTTFDNFGSCHLTTERVTMEHSGYWKIFVVFPGKVLLEEVNFRVIVREAERKVIVSTNVELEKPSVLLSCSVPNGHTVRACKFRDPKGNTLIAAQGIGEDSLYGSEVRYESNVSNQECGIHITNPTQDDVGLWRCAIEIGSNTHYGFISVICPWLIQDADVNATGVIEPTLTSEKINVTAIEGESVIMSCSIQSPIRYCYFRSRNGTVYTVTRESSTTMEYVGNGFEAGECGIRLTGLRKKDSGPWYCHVGLDHKAEQKVEIYVTIQEPITAYQWNYPEEVVIKAFINIKKIIEYLRFIRYDGLGFTHDNVPNGYLFLGPLDQGIGHLVIHNATYLDLYPWTVVAMIRGYGELSKQTELIWKMPEIDEENSYDQPYNVINLNPINRISNKGSSATMEVRGNGAIDSCQYRAPNGVLYQFRDSEHFFGVSIPDVGNDVVCRLSIGPLEEVMFGDWVIMGKFSGNGIFTEIIQPFTLVQGAGEAFPDVDPKWLPQIDHITRTGQFVDIALNNIGHEEICYFENPAGEQGNNEIGMFGVTVHESSEFVSCRITVGPMEPSFVGNWTLCGCHGENNQYERCRRVNIAWLNNNNPSATWQVSQQISFDYPVNLGGYLKPAVNGSGTIISCHVVTPRGEDLVITSNSRYPGIQLEVVSSTSLCAVSIGPIERWMLGEWTVYGRFRRQQVTSEARLPMTVSLCDEENSCDQLYNVTNLNPINRISNLGSSTTMEVAGSGNIDSCQYRAPNGELYHFTDFAHFLGVTILDVANVTVCRISIGPIQEVMLGEWQLIGKFSGNGIFTEIRQPFTLIRGDGGLSQSQTSTEWLPRIDRVTRTGLLIDIALNNINQTETCYFITPSGQDSTQVTNIAGVTAQNSSNFVSCRITVGPMDRSLLGVWTICGTYEERVRCQNVNITWFNTKNAGAGWQVSQQSHFDHPVNLGGYLRLTVSGAGTTRSCHVVTPFGEDLVITSDSQYPGIHLETVSSTSVCAIRIGPIERWMLGEWTVYGKFRRQVTTETKLPMNLFLYDEENPYDQPYNVTNLYPINRISNMGSSATMEVRGSGAIDSCQYRAPNGVLYPFSDSKHFFGVSIPDVGNEVVCRLSIGPLEEVMFGDWVIMGKFSGNGIFTEIIQPFTLVQGAGEAFPDVDPEWLPQIDHITRTGQFVDIALNNIGHEEICYFENPAGGQGNNEIGMLGVTVHESSEFVSCRITVGPMESSFVGNWTLCGHYGENNQYKRCRRVNIAWLNNNNPSANWQVSQQTSFDYPVNLGGYLKPAVNGSGTIISCHVVTPRGEDLVITSNSRYPGIQLEVVSSTSLCAVSIGPIERWMLGEWTVYGRFRRQQVTSEARLPMTVSLYDEENPYDQPYNVTNLNPINRISNLGSSTTMEVAGSGNIDSCQYRAPNGELYHFTDIAHFLGVTIPDVANVIVCRISIGPIQEVMLGEWQLIGKFSRNSIFTEIRQPFTLIRGAGDEFPDVEPVWLPQIDRVTRTGQFVDIALYNKAQNEVCYFENPAGGQGNNEIEMYGVKVHESSEFVSCRITVGPMEPSLLGTWTLCGHYGGNNQYKRCQRVNIAWLNTNNPGATWQVSQQALFNHSVNIGGYLRPTVSGAGTTRSCHVVTPYGEDLVITSDSQYPGIHLETLSSTSVCAIRIGPIERWMLGEWTVYGKFRRQATTETRLPMNLILYDEENPYDQPYNITNLNPINRISNLGSSTTMEVAGSGNVDSCQYRAPNGELYHFTDIAHFLGVTILDVANVTVCRISIGPIQEVMLGEWQLIGKFSGNGIFTEIRQPFTLIRGAEVVSPDVEPIWLPQIDRVTRTGQFVDIALHNIQQDEICTFENPSGGQGNSEIDMYGVTMHRSSEFVACRITVGPMESSLLGTWILCGRYGEVNQYKRCQRVNIEWLNTNNPGATWQVSQQQPFTHRVSLGGSLRPTVSGAGTTRSCHVVTPYGEDLVITSNSRYPGIQLDTVISTSMCAISIGPIERWMLGEWTIYGKFRRQVTTETRLPITVVLYDEDDPYTQPYNVTTLNAFNRIISLNTNTSVEVTGSGNIDSCEYRAPDGNTYLFSDSMQYPGVYIPNVGNSIICRIVIGPIEEVMLGEWQITGKFSSNDIFTEIRQPFTIIKEDPDNPVIEDRIIQNLSEINLKTNVGAREKVTISEASLTMPETCHIRTPAGRQYIMSESFNVTGVTPLTGSGIECGVIIEILSEDMVGAWTLISRATSPLGRIERRLPFILHVEDQVDAFPREVTITEHNNLFVRLRDPTEEYETCRLVGPRGSNNSPHEIDASHTKSCGYIIKDIQMIDQGVWQIVYGARIVYRASINVRVNARGASFIEDLVLIKDSKVNKTIGPYDAVYCKLEDPHGFTTFDSFGSCQLTTERVTMEHSGYWKIFIGSPGRVLLEEFNFMVTVEEAESNIVVVPRVERQAPSVVLSCSVSDTYTVRACKFRDPKGNVLIAAQGIGEDRYSFYGSEVRYKSNVSHHECGVRITNPSQDDLGLWRCAMETEKSTHYGFLSVICPWLMQDPEIQASVVTVPILTADRSNVTAIEGESVIMSCSIPSPIRYCYFRASNGTVYSVTPESSSPTEYVGNGFSAGECGVRFRGLMSTDSGRWNCHVGFSNGTEEQRVQIDVKIQEPITVRHYWHESHGLVAEAFIHSDRHLEYCRFIRFDGLGFVTGGIPYGYKFIGSLDNGHCLLQIQEASELNLHSWTIVARIRGQGVELFRQTTDNLLWTESVFSSMPIYLWFLIILMAIIILVLGTMLGPKKNRSWTYDRASQFRTSIRNSFRKMKRTQTA